MVDGMEINLKFMSGLSKYLSCSLVILSLLVDQITKAQNSTIDMETRKKTGMKGKLIDRKHFHNLPLSEWGIR